LLGGVRQVQKICQLEATPSSELCRIATECEQTLGDTNSQRSARGSRLGVTELQRVNVDGRDAMSSRGKSPIPAPRAGDAEDAASPLKSAQFGGDFAPGCLLEALRRNRSSATSRMRAEVASAFLVNAVVGDVLNMFNKRNKARWV
jgi:hypothetical protein